MKTYIYLIASLFFITGFQTYSHQNKKNIDATQLQIAQEKLEHINHLYSQSIEPIFKQKCLDCHGGTPNFPWYHRLPLAKKLMDYDVTEGKKHLDISHGFPFKGHGTPLDDLQELEEVIQEKSMPPMRYWLLHWKCRVTKEDKQAILTWIEQSKKILQ